jgi:hypothetical protein
VTTGDLQPEKGIVRVSARSLGRVLEARTDCALDGVANPGRQKCWANYRNFFGLDGSRHSQLSPATMVIRSARPRTFAQLLVYRPPNTVHRDLVPGPPYFGQFKF